MRPAGWIPNLVIISLQKTISRVWSAVLGLMEMLDLDQLFRNRHKCSFVRFLFQAGGS